MDRARAISGASWSAALLQRPFCHGPILRRRRLLSDMQPRTRPLQRVAAAVSTCPAEVREREPEEREEKRRGRRRTRGEGGRERIERGGERGEEREKREETDTRIRSRDADRQTTGFGVRPVHRGRLQLCLQGQVCGRVSATEELLSGASVHSPPRAQRAHRGRLTGVAGGDEKGPVSAETTSRSGRRGRSRTARQTDRQTGSAQDATDGSDPPGSPFTDKNDSLAAPLWSPVPDVGSAARKLCTRQGRTTDWRDDWAETRGPRRKGKK